MKAKKILVVLSVVFSVVLVSCDTASTAKEAEEDSIEAINEAATEGEDTTLSSISDSLKADIGDATNKIKQHSKELGDAAKEKANEGVDKFKEGAQKVKDAADAGVDAAKEKLK